MMALNEGIKGIFWHIGKHAYTPSVMLTSHFEINNKLILRRVIKPHPPEKLRRRLNFRFVADVCALVKQFISRDDMQKQMFHILLCHIAGCG